MHFYDFNIGDYAKKTQHLTNEEDLAYRRLLDLYYDSENPVLTSGLATLSRRLRVSEQSLENVLSEFFPDGKNKHADEKIAEYYAYLAKQKANGSKGGRKKQNPPLTTGLPSANPSPSQPEAINQKLTPSVSHEKIVFDGSGFQNINGQLSAWVSAYPAVDVPSEIKKAAVWLMANPANKKSNYARFLTNWISKAQDKAPRLQTATGIPKGSYI